MLNIWRYNKSGIYISKRSPPEKLRPCEKIQIHFNGEGGGVKGKKISRSLLLYKKNIKWHKIPLAVEHSNSVWDRT